MRNRPLSLARTLLARTGLGAVLLALCAGVATLPAQAADARSDATFSVASAGSARAADSAYTSREFEWFDAMRGRAVPVRLYLPEAASIDRPVPLVVFSPSAAGEASGPLAGWGSRRRNQEVGSGFPDPTSWRSVCQAVPAMNSSTALRASSS